MQSRDFRNPMSASEELLVNYDLKINISLMLLNNILSLSAW